MTKTSSKAILFAAGVAIAAPGHAQEAEPAAAAQAPPSSQLVLSDAELGTLRGGEEIIVTNQTLEAITSGNLINGDYTAGSVSMSDNALSNFNGIGNLVINTGAQVSLQSGMNLTITVGR